MRVVIDEQAFLLQRHGGMSRYFVSLAEHLPQAGVDPVLPYRRVVSDHAVQAIPGLTSVPSSAARLIIGYAHVRPPRTTPGIDVVHHSFFHSAWLKDEPGTPKVITVHDMIPEQFPDAVPDGVHLSKREYVAGAAAIICVSDATRRALIESYGPIDSPIVVVPHGVSPEFGRPVDRLDLPDDYVLYVGLRGGYKDFDVLLDALRSSPDSSVHLVAVGGEPWDAHADSLAGLGDRVHHLALDDGGIISAYQHARCLVVPSRVEGFGLPVLEAMSAGTPVIVSTADALQEVGGDAVRTFRAGDPDDLARAIGDVLADRDLRLDLIERGRRRVLAFTPERCAELTAQAYAAAVSQSR